MIKLGISGCCGKMGTRISRLALLDKDFKIVLLLEQKQHPSIGKLFEGRTKITDDPYQIKNCDCLVEFSCPEATVEHVEICRKFSRAIVIGTTGLNDLQNEIIVKASEKIPIVLSSNMSTGVNIFFKLIKEAALLLAKDYKVYITESHHIHKKDAPSGTAKQMAKIVKDIRKKDVDDIKSIREGEIIGEHRICFESEDDLLTLSHSAKSRDIFAKGALVAAKFIVSKKNGLFDMQEVLKFTANNKKDF